MSTIKRSRWTFSFNLGAMLARALELVRGDDQPAVSVGMKVEHRVPAKTVVHEQHGSGVADTGVRIGEASALRWTDMDLTTRTARIARSFSGGRYLNATKTGRERVVELSTRLRGVLAPLRPDPFANDTLMFPSESGGFLDPNNFRDRVFRKLVKRVVGGGRRFTPHGLRHTFATLHLARGTNLKWVQSQGVWASTKMLLDTYGPFIPTETTGYADVLSEGPGRPLSMSGLARWARAGRQPRDLAAESWRPGQDSNLRPAA